MQGNNSANSAHLQHITSSLPKKWQWPKNRCPTVTICPPDCDDGKSIFDRHFSLSYTETLLSAIAEKKNEGSQRTHCLLFVFFPPNMRDRKKEKRRRRDWNALPPTEHYLSNGPLSGDKLILEIRGHLLCLFTCSQHTAISDKNWPSCTLRELMWGVGWAFLLITVTTSKVQECVCTVYGCVQCVCWLSQQQWPSCPLTLWTLSQSLKSQVSHHL